MKKIRPENQSDRTQIATLIARTYLSEGANVIEKTGRLRALDGYDNAVSLVEEVGGKIISFALFTPFSAGQGKGLFLAPLAFDERSEDLDLTAFLEASFEKVSTVGYRYVFVQGVLGDLKAFGFTYAEDAGFEYKDKRLLVKDLGVGAPASGLIVLPEVLEES